MYTVQLCLYRDNLIGALTDFQLHSLDVLDVKRYAHDFKMAAQVSQLARHGHQVVGTLRHQLGVSAIDVFQHSVAVRNA